LASLDLARAEFKANKTTDAKRPIIAITTNNSIKVKPFSFLFLKVFTPNLNVDEIAKSYLLAIQLINIIKAKNQ
jgi:hypothetical protein